MKLDDTQTAKVVQWIEQGAKLSEIQTRLASELGVKLTYMEVRFLVDDLKLVPKDPEPPKAAEPPTEQSKLTTKPVPEDEVAPLQPPSPTGTGSVSVTLDQIARPGALVSGKVKFSDGQAADWTLDQMGRLGLVPQQKGYRPSPVDVEQFQVALQNELAKMGF
jgi:hypothetical protein